MSIPRPISNIRALASDYDAMLCDAWGVIHDGVNLLPGAEAALVNFRKTSGPVVILTNAPRPSSIIPAQLDRLGLAREAYDAVVTSGDATRDEIVQRLPAPAYRIGPEKDDPLFDGLGINFVELDAAGFIICTGPVDDQNDEPEDYRSVLERAAARGLEMVCANPDIVVNWGGRIIWCAGAIAELYEKLGGVIAYGGKPHAPIYRLAFDAVARAHGAPVGAARILAVGDGLNTDILGANRAGIDALLVTGAGGIHNGSPEQADMRVIGAMEGLRW